MQATVQASGVSTARIGLRGIVKMMGFGANAADGCCPGYSMFYAKCKPLSGILVRYSSSESTGRDKGRLVIDVVSSREEIGQRLDCPYEEKDVAKKLGAIWSTKGKFWWVPKEIDLEPFARWLPKEGFVSCQKLRETRASKNTQSGPSTQFVYPAVARLVSLLLQQTCGVKVAEEEYSMQFDGGSRSAEQCSAAAAVLSVGGKQVWFRGEFLRWQNPMQSISTEIANRHGVTNNEAEYIALVMGLAQAYRLGVRRMRVRGDSLLVVNQVNLIWKCQATHLLPYRDMSMQLMSMFQCCEVSHVRREENQSPDQVANAAMDAQHNIEYTNMAGVAEQSEPYMSTGALGRGVPPPHAPPFFLDVLTLKDARAVAEGVATKMPVFPADSEAIAAVAAEGAPVAGEGAPKEGPKINARSLQFDFDAWLQRRTQRICEGYALEAPSRTRWLKKMLQDLGLSTKGNKAALVERLKEAVGDRGDETSDGHGRSAAGVHTAAGESR